MNRFLKKIFYLPSLDDDDDVAKTMHKHIPIIPSDEGPVHFARTIHSLLDTDHTKETLELNKEYHINNKIIKT